MIIIRLDGTQNQVKKELHARLHRGRGTTNHVLLVGKYYLWLCIAHTHPHAPFLVIRPPGARSVKMPLQSDRSKTCATEGRPINCITVLQITDSFGKNILYSLSCDATSFAVLWQRLVQFSPANATRDRNRKKNVFHRYSDLWVMYTRGVVKFYYPRFTREYTCFEEQQPWWWENMRKK